METETAKERGESGGGDADSIGGIIAALYASISFEPGGEADWDRLRRLCAPYALLVHAPASPEGSPVVLDVETFIAKYKENIARSELSKRGFREREIASKVEAFGNIAQVFSSYAAGWAGGEVFARGVNSIQLMRANGRWWVLTILWDDERDEKARGD
jgi:hypothetical protein